MSSHRTRLTTSSTEVRVLQEEGEHLSKVLKKAFPTDKRDSWTYADLEDAVKMSRQTWESKERIGHGKPQKLFHTLMRKFDGHSNLFQFIPSGNVYASVVTGATAVLVKASVNHSKTIEELSDALDAITEAVSIGEVESDLVKSQAMQSAVAKLYIAIFLFFGDAATWYKSSATSKVVHSLHKNFSERFRKSLNTIKELAASVRYIAQLGSQAEVRVVRLEVEELQEQLHDMRVGMFGGLRQLAEYLDAQHGENMKQHEKTQELLAEYRTTGLLPPRPVADREYQNLVQSTGDFAMIEPPTFATVARNADIAQPDANKTTSRKIPNGMWPLWKQLDKLVDTGSREIEPQKNRQALLVDRNVSQAITRWLSLSDSIVYLEYLSAVPGEDTIRKLRIQLTASLVAGGQMVVPLLRGITSRIQSCLVSRQQRATILILCLAYELYNHNTNKDDQLESEWNQSVSIRDITFDKTISLLSNTLSHCRPQRLHVVLSGYPFLADMDSAQYEVFIKTLRDHMNKDSRVLKVIILARVKMNNLTPHLHPHEMALLKQQTGKQKPAKVPLVMPGLAWN